MANQIKVICKKNFYCEGDVRAFTIGKIYTASVDCGKYELLNNFEESHELSEESFNETFGTLKERPINIALLDHSTTQVAIYSNIELESNDNEAVEAYLTEQGHHMSNCSYMTSEGEIEVDYFN